MVAGRLQRGYETDRPGVNTAITPPAELLRRVHVDCVCHDEHAVGLAEKVFGEENVLFGSDWPFPMGIVEPKKQMGSYGAERLHRLFDGNPAGLLARLEEQGARRR